MKSGYEVIKSKELKPYPWDMWMSVVCSTNELKTVDKNTPVDEAGGIKYTFDFTGVESDITVLSKCFTIEKLI